MKTYNKSSKINNSINSFNPSYISKIINFRKNKDICKIKINTPLFFHRNKYSNSLKAHNFHYNLNNNNNKKILENTDLSNDIKIYNNNSTYKTSLSTNNTNTNYYSKRRRQLLKNVNTIESDTTQSRNFNKYNGKSLSKTTWSSFSFTEGANNISPLINGHEYSYNMKIQNLKGGDDKYNYNCNGFKIIKCKEYDLNKLKENGIKYCIDEDGNPMNIIDIKLKNKKPIAFIIQKPNNNLLIDLEKKIITPNYNGDYILHQKPYFIIKKYNVQYPELRVNNIQEKKSINYNTDNNYISINVNESNENIKNINSIAINRERNFRRKNNKSCNIYNYSYLGDGLNKINDRIDNSKMVENNKMIENKMNIINPNNQMKNNYKVFKNSLREKKRKYIFVNKLTNTNKSIQLKINNNEDNEDNDNYNSIKKLIQSSNTCKNKDIDKIYFFNENKKEPISIFGKHKKNHKIFLKNINKLQKLKNKNNKLKDIKCFTHNEIKNLEFKFERKYKNINSANTTQPSFLTEYKYRKIEETPKDNKEKRKIKKGNMTIKSENINFKNDIQNIESEIESSIKKKYIIENINNLDLKKYKKKRCSNSLNQFMFNSLDKKNNNLTTPQNMVNTLSAFNHSFISPTAETTSYNTIQNLHIDSEKDKKTSINTNNDYTNIKKFNSFKYYLKPKINSQKVFHKRIKTEDMNRSDTKKFRFLKSICGNDKNNVNNNSIKAFYYTESEFSVNNCKHILSNSVEKKINIFNSTNTNINTNTNTNTNTNNNVCKCPYCHHLFYN
jgi:hypothetical protein